MSSRNLDLLVPGMKEKVLTFRDLCEGEDLEILIYCTYRSLEEQALLYCRGRVRETVRRKASALIKKGLEKEATILLGERVRPNRSKVTYAAPGESWHNYYEAIDAVPLVNGKALWSVFRKKKGVYVMREEWKIFGEAVRRTGLQWAGDWLKTKEYVHMQLRPGRPGNYKDIRSSSTSSPVTPSTFPSSTIM